MISYGKALGGGYPIGVFGGRSDIMSLCEENLMGKDEKYVWTASSLGGNPISCAAANAALDILELPIKKNFCFYFGVFCVGMFVNLLWHVI